MLNIQNIIYQLKKKYGQPVDFYKERSEDIEVQTGKKIIKREKYHINKAVFLKERSTFNNPLAIKLNQIAPNSGLLEVTDTELLIDGRDFPKNFVPNSKDHILINNERYEIKKFSCIDDKQSYYFILKEYKGNILHQIHDQNIIQKLTLINVMKPRHEILWSISLIDNLFLIETTNV